jgi:hypothetical protein
MKQLQNLSAIKEEIPNPSPILNSGIKKKATMQKQLQAMGDKKLKLKVIKEIDYEFSEGNNSPGTQHQTKAKQVMPKD